MAEPRESGLIVVDEARRAWLAARGIRLGHAASRLLPESGFEAPSVVQAAIRPGHQVEVGAYTGVFGGQLGRCRIGRFCSIAPGADIAADQHPVDWLSSSMIQYVPDVHGWDGWRAAHGSRHAALRPRFSAVAPTEIGNDVWIGAGVFIRSGLRIGDGAIVAAHAVVVKDVPPYHIVGGNPARIIRPRFPAPLIERLLRLRWWQYDVFALEGLDPSRIEDAVSLIEDAAARGALRPLPVQQFRAIDLENA